MPKTVRIITISNVKIYKKNGHPLCQNRHQKYEEKLNNVWNNLSDFYSLPYINHTAAVDSIHRLYVFFRTYFIFLLFFVCFTSRQFFVLM